MTNRLVTLMAPLRNATPAVIEIILPTYLSRYWPIAMPKTVKNSAIAFMKVLTRSLLQATMARETTMKEAIPGRGRRAGGRGGWRRW